MFVGGGNLSVERCKTNEMPVFVFVENELFQCLMPCKSLISIEQQPKLQYNLELTNVHDERFQHRLNHFSFQFNSTIPSRTFINKFNIFSLFERILTKSKRSFYISTVMTNSFFLFYF